MKPEGKALVGERKETATKKQMETSGFVDVKGTFGSEYQTLYQRAEVDAPVKFDVKGYQYNYRFGASVVGGPTEKRRA